MRMAALSLLAFALQPHAVAAETLRTNGVEIEYRITGQGEPLLLLHGFGSCIDHSWGSIIPELAKSYRVIAVNQRGHGRSTNPSGAFTHAESAADIRNLMDALGIRSARAIGYSSGGMTLLHLATGHPERLSKLVLVGATSHFGEQARRVMRAVASDGLPPPVQAQFVRCAARGEAQASELARQFGAFKDSHRDMNFKAPDLARISASTLIVHGDRDDFFPVAIPVSMYAAIPKSQLWIVPGGDHSPTAGAPLQTFVDTVKDFLAK